MNNLIVIRQFQPGDRAGIRQLCCDTADAGNPVEGFFSDRDLIADLVTRYYTDVEPSSCWVADDNGQVIGYLTGCLHPRQFARAMRWRIAPRAIAGAVLRGALFRRDTWRMLRAMTRTALLRRQGNAAATSEAAAHLHVNIRSGYRGQRVGHRLMTAFLQQANAAGAADVSISVRGDNAAGLRFFEREGFVRDSVQPLILPRARDMLQTNVVILKRPTGEL